MTASRRPGRPRDPRVAARDEQVYTFIASGTASRSELAAATGYDRDAIFLSCKRLRQAGRIEQTLGPNGTINWTTTSPRDA
jgi:hypothetical protein